MEIHLSPENEAQLNEYAQRHGQDPASALEAALAAYLEWERQDYQESLEGIRQGYSDHQAGRSELAEDALEALRIKHDLPG